MSLINPRYSSIKRLPLITMMIGVMVTVVGSFAQAAPARPNIILCMADDLGWGDTAYNGHPRILTPHLDTMATTGVRFNRFYAAAPVCSPTRGSCLTARHPYRYGINGANSGHMPEEELTLAEALKKQGYRTGHFGKWHLGTLTKTVRDSNRGGQEKTREHYSPPWDNGFDVCFSTEAKVPTYDPMLTPIGWENNTDPEKPFGTFYWTGPEERVTDNLEGDDSRIIMDRAIPFINEATDEDAPFFMVLWFHAPHLPSVAGPKHREPYKDLPEEAQHYFGCITAMDEQIGRLRDELRTLGIAENTMLWFCSDNGPEGGTDTPENGTTGPYRGRKRDLYEGGVRVPGLLEWPGGFPEARTIDTASCTSDYLPTLLDVLGITINEGQEPRDGISLLPILKGEKMIRNAPIGFAHGTQRSWMDDQYKLISVDNGKTFELYDLIADPGEQANLADEFPDRVDSMKKAMAAWYKSCRDDSRGI